MPPIIPTPPLFQGLLPNDPSIALDYEAQATQCGLYNDYLKTELIPYLNDELVYYINNQESFNKGDDGASPVYVGEWNNTTAYNFLERVTYLNNTYSAKSDVPAGTPLTDTSYWILLTGVSGNAPMYYLESGTPTATINPVIKTFWVNTDNGDVYVCVDNTIDANVWVSSFVQQQNQGTVPISINTIDFFGDGSGIELFTFDEQGSNGTYNGTLSDLVSDASSYSNIFGVYGSALRVENDDVVGTSFTLPTDYSINFRFKLSSSVSTGSMFEIKEVNVPTNNAQSYFRLGISSSGLGWDYLHPTNTNGIDATENGNASFSFVLEPNVFHTFSMTMTDIGSGSFDAKFYINGTLVLTSSNVGSYIHQLLGNSITRSFLASNLWAVDQLREFNRVLTDAQIMQLYLDEK